MGLNFNSNLLRLIRYGGGVGGGWGWRGMCVCVCVCVGGGTYVFPPTRYTVTTRITALLKARSCVSLFNVLVIVRAKSQDSVHKPQFLKRRERRAEPDRTKVLLLTSQAPNR